jgi:hypothetical protein
MQALNTTAYFVAYDDGLGARSQAAKTREWVMTHWERLQAYKERLEHP